MRLQSENNDYPQDKLIQSAFKVLDSAHLCSIATVTKDSQAHINAAFYCYNNDLEIFFLSETNSQHAQNLLSNPSVALTIFDTHQAWGSDLLGLQIFGECHIASVEDHIKAAILYRSRFPIYVKHINGFLLNYRFFKVKPHSIKLIDEAQFPEDEHISLAVNYDLKD